MVIHEYYYRPTYEQYRKPLAFPGAQIDEIKAYNFVKTMGELNHKPLRLRRIGFNWGYPTFIKASVFGTHLITDINNRENVRNIYNFGSQIDIQFVLFSYLKTTWSFGYARLIEREVNNKGQFMFSLKLLGR